MLLTPASIAPAWRRAHASSSVHFVARGADPSDGIKLTPMVTMTRADPYRAFEQLRPRGPVFYSPTVGAFLVIGLAEAHQVLKDPRMGRADLWAPMFLAHPRGAETIELFRSTVLFSDPPDHGRLRAFMSRAFQPKVIEALRSAIEEIVDALLDDLAKAPSTDIVSSLALPMPVEVIAKLVGVPREDWPKCIEWSEALAPLIDAVIPADILDHAVSTGFEFAAYIRALVQRRRRAPENDILSALVRGLDDDGGLSEDELAANVITLFTAGHETMTNLIANTFVLLSQHPEARATYEADPAAHLDGLIEESMRFEPPVQLAARVAQEATVIGDVYLDAGQAAWVLIGAANRDPSRFEDAKRFDITRRPNPHIAFGSGIHYCLGAALSRLEAHLTFERFFARFPRWRLADQTLVLRPTSTLRGYVAVELELNG